MEMERMAYTMLSSLARPAANSCRAAMRGFGSAFSDAIIEVRTRQVGEGVEKAEAEVGDLEKWLKDAPRAANGDVCEPAVSLRWTGVGSAHCRWIVLSSTALNASGFHLLCREGEVEL